jgi:fatty-acyl-CoA synthase
MHANIPGSVPELMARLATRDDRRVVVYDRRGRRAEERTYAALMQRAFAAGRAYLDAGLEPGDHVFLQLPHSLRLIEHFLGCIAVGILPCCVSPPRALGGIEVFRRRMRHFQERLPRFHLVADPDVGEHVELPYRIPPTAGHDAKLSLAEVDGDATAFIQLTSGSTGTPRAVCISHRAVLANCANALTAIHADADADVFVTWLPLYHDMGLVGGLFCSLVMPCDLHTMPSSAFVARPETWLRVISDVDARVVSNAPNFAYRFCVQRVGEDAVDQFDLSRWRVAGSGAERIRADTLDAFAKHFARSGFRKESFVPCYGMAEATLAVSCGDDGLSPRVEDGHVSCGRAIPGTQVAIRDVDGHVLAEGMEGEVTVRSDSLCSGYLDSSEPALIRGGWLYTGDRGYLSDGEIFVTGRYRDLIIVDGVNIDCSEIEAIADDVTAEVATRSGAFALERDGQERVVLVSETTPQAPEVLAAWADEIHDQVSRAFGVRLADLIFVRRGSIHKTSSGKVRRGELRRAYSGNELDVVWRQPVAAAGDNPRQLVHGGGP